MGAGNPAAVLAAWAEAYTRLLETANTQGAFGMVVNMETHQPWTAAVAKHVNQPFPKEYQGAPRLIVPCVRSVVGKDEALQLKIIALLNKPVESVTVHLRPMGQGAWKTLSARHVARAVFEATLPPTTEDCEYFITAGDLVWPATAPTLNQTVIVTP